VFGQPGGISSNVYTIKTDGTDVVQLTHETGGTVNDGADSWSPDGTKIAFVSNRTGRYQIYTMNADGTDVKQLTNATDAHLAAWGQPSLMTIQRAWQLSSVTGYLRRPAPLLSLRHGRNLRPLLDLWPEAGLPPDDVMDLEHLRRTDELDAVLGEDRHQALTERLELLLRVPDLAHPEAATSSEGDVKLEPVRRELARCLDAGHRRVVLLG
jgi:hypothetical protein